MKLKLKQKKVILGITCGVMVIGLCALSFTKKDKGNDATEAGNAQEASATPGATGEATPAPTENPVLTGTLEKNAHEDINALIGTYLKASVEADIKAIEVSQFKAREDLDTKKEALSCIRAKAQLQAAALTYLA